jgi:hypothetical protein
VLSEHRALALTASADTGPLFRIGRQLLEEALPATRRGEFGRSNADHLYGMIVSYFSYATFCLLDADDPFSPEICGRTKTLPG